MQYQHFPLPAPKNKSGKFLQEQWKNFNVVLYYRQHDKNRPTISEAQNNRKMKKSDTGLKIFSATLIALLITGLLHRFVYFAFSMERTGQVFRYNRELWKQYYEWLPGKILCIAIAILILALIVEAVYFIFCGRKNWKSSVTNSQVSPMRKRIIYLQFIVQKAIT